MTGNRKELIKKGLYFFIGNSVIAFLISLRYFKHIHIYGDFLSIFFTAGLALSHLFLIMLILYSLICIPVALLSPNRKLYSVFLIILTVFLQFVLLLDTYTFDLYRFHINSFVLDMVFGAKPGQIFEFNWKIYLLFFIIIGVLLTVEIALSRITFRGIFKIKFLKQLIITQFSIWLIANLIYTWADAAFYKPVTSSARVFPLFMPLQAADFLYNNGIVKKDKAEFRLKSVEATKDMVLSYPLSRMQTVQPEKPLNIMWIVIDSWNYRCMDSVTTPNIFKFSAVSEVYTNHYSGSNGTRTGIFSLFYSIPGLYWYDFLDAQVSPVFIDELIKYKYRFGIFASAGLSNPPFDRTIFRRINLEHNKNGNANERDIQITDEWLDFIRIESDSSFFTFLFYDSPHTISHPSAFKGPWQPEWEYAKYQELNNNMDPAPFFNLYRNSVNYVDSLVGIVFENLEKNNLLGNTVVLITGDHGQEFNENKKNYWGHNGNYSQAQLGVPLIVYYPGVQHRVFSHWTTHYDLVPTMLEDFFACKNNSLDYSGGKNLKDTTQIQYLIVGSKDNFGIVEKNRITSISFSRNFDITDNFLNPLPDETLQSELFKKILIGNNRFYRKKEE